MAILLFVEKEKLIIPNTARKIFATVQVITPEKGIKVKAMLTYLKTHGVIGPSIGEVTKTGNILKAFSFTRSSKTWPKGDYEVVVSLSTGDTKTIKFEVR